LRDQATRRYTWSSLAAGARRAALVTDSARREGLSFAVLHKFFLMDWAGKTVRDLVAIFSALGVLMVTLYGLALLLGTRRRA
jgi:hypothetical protein